MVKFSCALFSMPFFGFEFLVTAHYKKMLQSSIEIIYNTT